LAFIAVRVERAKNMRPYSSLPRANVFVMNININIVNLLTEVMKFMHYVYQDDTGNFWLQRRSWSDFRRELHCWNRYFSNKW